MDNDNSERLQKYWEKKELARLSEKIDQENTVDDLPN
jgi:hypothetical protein